MKTAIVILNTGFRFYSLLKRLFLNYENDILYITNSFEGCIILKCEECYSDNPRITPLRGAEDCLRNHLQYVCSTCGRVICIGPQGAKKARCLMPFGSLEQAKLYLKAAEIMNESLCGIYELIYSRGDTRYRIFKSVDELKEQLKKNRNIRCENFTPVYVSEKYVPVPEDRIRRLTEKEVQKYLSERKMLGIK